MISSRIPTVTTSAATYNLVVLADVKTELGIASGDTTNDVWLAKAITQISQAVLTYIDRVPQVEALSELAFFSRVGYSAQIDRSARFQLSRWPIVSVSSVIQDVGLDSALTLVAGTDYTVRPDLGEVWRIDSTSGLLTRWLAETVTIVYTAGYGALSTESYTVTGGTPSYTVNQAANFSIDQGVVYSSSGIALTKVTTLTGAGQYTVNASTGVYNFSTADNAQALKVTYGYNAVPSDILDAAFRLITARFRAKQRDPMLMERTQPGGVGTERYWVSAKQQGTFSPEITGLLDPYRVPVTA